MVIELVVVSMYESLLSNIKTKLLQSKRTNAKLESKLFELFDINNAEFKKIARMYSGNRSKYPKETIFDKINYELQQVENYKKSKYGENYAKTNG